MTVQVTRSGQEVTLNSDGKPFTGRTPGTKSGLKLTSDLWVGGVNSSVHLPGEVKFEKGFIGCMQHVKVCVFLLRSNITQCEYYIPCFMVISVTQPPCN